MRKTIFSLLVIMPLTTAAQNFNIQIDKRQNTFKEIETISKQVDRMLSGNKTNWEELENQSQKLTAHSTALLSLFPPGSQAGSKAKSEIWSKPGKFNQLLTLMDLGFKELYQASKTKNIELAKVGLAHAQNTCRNCHRSYRSHW